MVLYLHLYYMLTFLEDNSATVIAHVHLHSQLVKNLALQRPQARLLPVIKFGCEHRLRAKCLKTFWVENLHSVALTT